MTLLFGLGAHFLEREQFGLLLSWYSLLFAGFAYLMWNREQLTRKAIWGWALFFRLALLASIPQLSNDFYRFLWDGRLLAEGYNPFLHQPESLLADKPGLIAQGRELVQGMGSLNASNFSCYPPLNQLLFLIPEWLSDSGIRSSVIVMRLLIIAADLGTLWFGWKLLRKLGKDPRWIALYILNPFQVMEVSGNLHFEGVMIFFLVLALYTLLSGKWIWSAVFFSFSVAVKLIPLIFLPLLWKQLGWRKALLYYGLVFLVQVILWAPFLGTGLLSNFGNTLALYFESFEFNASIYYLVREVGFWIKGYNIIGTAGKVLSLVVFFLVLGLSFFRANQRRQVLLISMLFAISGYYALATTLHPWYICTPLILCVFTPYRFPVVWSFVSVLSYAAYSHPNFQETLYLIALEYLVVYGVFFYEVRLKKT